MQNGDKITIGEHILRFELLDEIDREYQRQIRRLLSHDDLTGLLSSRSFFSELRRESSRADAEKRPFCVLMMDVDYFKNVNDTYGHLTGSKTLEEIGLCITQNLAKRRRRVAFRRRRICRVFARCGARRKASSRRRESARKSKNRSSASSGKANRRESHHITISIGIASFPDDSSDPIELVEMADSALYRAKREGRNRVCAYRDLTEQEMNKALLTARDEGEYYVQKSDVDLKKQFSDF